MPRLIQLLEFKTMPNIQHEAAWCITNIATGTRAQVQCLVEKGVIPKLIALINEENSNLVDQAIWALGNISGDNISFRNIILGYGIVPKLTNLLATTKNTEMLKNGCWVISNLTRGEPYPKFETVKDLIPTICKLIRENDDNELLIDCCTSLTNLAEIAQDKGKMFADNNILERLVKLLRYSLINKYSNTNMTVIYPVLRCLGSLLTGSDIETQMVIEAGVVKALGALLRVSKSIPRKEAAWALSNIAAGTEHQIQALINEGLINNLVDLASKDRFEVRRECIWCLSNAITNSNAEQIKVLVQAGATEAICSILFVGDPRTIAIALEGIENLLKRSNSLIGSAYLEEIILRIEKCKGLNALENLELHSNSYIYEKAIGIIEEFFGVEDEIESSDPPRSISIFDF